MGIRISSVFCLLTHCIIICSGLTEKTKLSFVSSNSSFTECVRKSYPFIFPIHSYSNEDYTGPIPYRTELSETSTFTSCTFNSEGPSGGAISFTGSGASLTVTDSLFNKCNATTGNGGAIYCHNCGKVSIQTSSLIECSALEYSLGGGIFIEGASVLPEITTNNFISCTGGEDTGGVDLRRVTGDNDGANLPVRECRFIGCVAYGKMADTTANNADSGGLEFWLNDFTLGISESIFLKCESKFRAGAVGLVLNSSRFDYVIRYCFFSENTAQKGNNVLVEFVDSTESLWDAVFLHSFTSDNDRSNSLVSTYDDSWITTPESDNWLP